MWEMKHFHTTFLEMVILYSSKMFQIQRTNYWEYLRNFRKFPTYGFSHVKFENPIFDPKIPEFVGGIDIILNDTDDDFQSWFCSTIKISVKLFGNKIPKFSEFKLTRNAKNCPYDEACESNFHFQAIETRHDFNWFLNWYHFLDHI